MATIQIWGGGPYHPTRAQAEVLREPLQAMGHEVHYGDDRSVFEPDRLRSADLLVMSGLDWSAITKVDPKNWVEPGTIPERYEPLAEEHFQAIREHLEAGKPLLCHHTSIISFDEREEFTEFFDGRWIDGRSTHSPYQEFDVHICDTEQPATAGLSDFRISDELYYNLIEPTRSHVLMEAEYEGRRWPLGWAGHYGDARILYSALGHDMQSYASPELQQFLLNSVAWLLDR